jgi:CheY-like chemotaxis protein
MDIQMPHIDGVQALKLIQITPFCHVPIFALTAYSMSGDKLKYLKLGFTGYLPKPITLSSLQSLFNEYSDSLIHLNSIGELQYYNSKQVYDLVSIIGYETYALTANEFLNEFSTYCSDLKVIDKSLFLKFLHTVKGSSATIGFEQLSVVSEFLETVYLETNFTEYSDSISLLATILNESIRFLHIFESKH